MTTKTSIIKETSALADLVKPNHGLNLYFVMHSEQYYAAGCDLRDLQSLDLAIRSLGNIDAALVLCIAEVSMTYMEPDAADALIAWASTLSAGMFSFLT